MGLMGQRVPKAMATSVSSPEGATPLVVGPGGGDHSAVWIEPALRRVLVPGGALWRRSQSTRPTCPGRGPVTQPQLRLPREPRQ